MPDPTTFEEHAAAFRDALGVFLKTLAVATAVILIVVAMEMVR